MPPQTPSVVTSGRRISLEHGTVLALAATIILALVIYIPSVAFPFVPTKSFVLAAGALVTLAAYILARLSRGNLILPPVTLVGALWLPTIAYILSAAFSGVGFSSATWGLALESDTLGFMLTLSALGTLTALAVRRPEHYSSFLKVGAWGGAAVVVLSLLVLVVGQFAPGVVSPSFSIVGSIKDLAAVLGLVVITSLVAARFLDLSPMKSRLMMGATILALLVLAALNISLVWVLVALVALALFVEAIMTRRSRVGADMDLEDTAVVTEATTEAPESSTGSRSFVMPLIVLAVSLFFFLGGTLGSALATALHTNGIDVRPSWRSTLNVGEAVYSHSPIFGSGPTTFGTDWLKSRDASLNSTVFWNLDFTSGIGFIPTSAVTTGIVGALAWLAMIGLLLFLGVRMLIARAPENPIVQFASIAAFVAAVYLLAIALLDLPGAVVLALTFISVGLFASTMRYAKGASQWGIAFSRAPRLGFVVVFLLTLVLLGSVGTAYALIERYVAIGALARAGAAYQVGDLDKAQTLANRSLAFAELPSAHSLNALVANARLGALLSNPNPPADAQQTFQTTLSGGITSAITATQLSPNDYQAWVALGNLYGSAVPLNVDGAYDSAKSAYQKAIALNPSNPQLYYMMAQLDVAHKDMKAAEEDLKQAITLKNDYTGAIFLLSQVLVADGNVQDALKASEAAAYFTPNDPNVLFQVGVLRAAAGDLPGSTQALSAAVAANGQFANARYFLAAVYAKQGQYDNALAQVKAIADLSEDNAKAVADTITSLEGKKDPFPPNLLSISTTPVDGSETAGTSATSSPAVTQ